MVHLLTSASKKGGFLQQKECDVSPICNYSHVKYEEDVNLGHDMLKYIMLLSLSIYVKNFI